MLAKPQTYMNASGESVAQLVSYFKIPLSQVLVVNIVITLLIFHVHCMIVHKLFFALFRSMMI
jgi:hypothetical protein